jgi:hypothetical protein
MTAYTAGGVLMSIGIGIACARMCRDGLGSSKSQCSGPGAERC